MRWEHPVSAPRNQCHSGEGAWVRTDSSQRCTSVTEGPAARCRSRASSSLQTAAAGPQRPSDTRSGSRNRTTVSRRTAQPAPRPEGAGPGAGAARPAARAEGRFLPGPARPAAEFPARSPASCVLWSRPPPLPCWIVRLPPPPLPPPREEGWRRSWEFSAVAGVRGQRPSGQSPAGRELGASLTPRGPPSAPPSRGLPPPPRAGGVERDAAPLTPLLPPLSPRGGTSARPLAGGHGPGLPAPPATP